MKWALLILAILVTIVLVALVVGLVLPKAHVASRRATLPAPPDLVWRTITDVDAFPSWRTDVRRIERLPDRDGRAVWVEDTSSGRITLATERAEPPRVLVVRIADPDLPFGGTWTYEIAPSGSGSTLTITEDGEIYNPIFRVMARFVFGYEATMASYLASLERKLQMTTAASTGSE